MTDPREDFIDAGRALDRVTRRTGRRAAIIIAAGVFLQGIGVGLLAAAQHVPGAVVVGLGGAAIGIGAYLIGTVRAIVAMTSAIRAELE